MGGMGSGNFMKVEPFDPAVWTSWNDVIKRWRISQGATPVDYGEIFLCSHTTIRNYETGKKEPDIYFWKDFCEMSGLNIAWVLFGEGKPFKGVPEGNLVMNIDGSREN